MTKTYWIAYIGRDGRELPVPRTRAPRNCLFLPALGRPVARLDVMDAETGGAAVGCWCIFAERIVFK